MLHQPLHELDTFDLLEHFEYAVRRNHYDPVDSHTPEYDYQALREEIERRLDKAPHEDNLEDD